MSQEDLKPVRSKEEAMSRGRKGGIASGKARAEKKSLQKALKMLLNFEYSVEDIDGKKTVDGYTSIGIALLKKAQSGDVQAITTLRDTIGEKPKDKVEMDNNIEVIFNIPRPKRDKDADSD